MKCSTALRAAVGLLIAIGASQVWASGYEKTIMFGGKSSGVAGIATPYIEGSSALYFNPAGLMNTKGTQDVTFNISPAWPQFKGPINNQNEVETSSRPMVTPYSLTYAHNLGAQWALSLGTYISGGAVADYNDVDFAGFPGTTHTKTDLIVTEYALGGSYKINDQWNVGLAWRVAQAEADFAFVKRSGPAVANAEVRGLKDTVYDAFKLGAQFKMSENTQFGLTYRSEVNFKAKGKVQTTARIPPVTTLDQGTTDASVKTTFPQAVTLGAVNKLSDSWKIFGEYAWTQYSRVKELNLVTAAATTTLEQKWKDQHNIRIAGEYMTSLMPVRFGYVWTSQVTDSEHARAAFVPPAPAHTITLGTGYAFGPVDLDGGFEYTWASGNSKNGATSGTTGTGTDVRDGKFSVNEYALHLGAKYTF